MQTFQRCVTQNTSPTPCRSTCCAAYAGRGLRIGQQSASTLTGHTPQRRLFLPNSTSANAAHRRADIASLTLAGRREHRECVAHRIMHRVRPCREAHCEEQRGDERADTTIAKREVFSNTCDDQNEQRKRNRRDPVDPSRMATSASWCSITNRWWTHGAERAQRTSSPTKAGRSRE